MSLSGGSGAYNYNAGSPLTRLPCDSFQRIDMDRYI